MRYAYLLILLLLCSVASAANFSASISPSSIKIKNNESAIFALSISHDSSQQTGFEAFTDVNWDLRTGEPLIVGKGGLTTQLTLTPLSVQPGIYSVPISIKRVGSSEPMKKDVLIEVVSSMPPQMVYLPSVRGSVALDSPVDPRNKVKIRVSLDNQNILDIARVDLKARGTYLNVDDTVSLKGLEKKVVTLEASMDPLTGADKDAVKVSVFAFDSEGRSYQTDLEPVSFEIGSYGDIEVVPIVSENWFKKVETIDLKNTGNGPRKTEYRLSIGWFDNVFTHVEPNAVRTSGYYEWPVSLGVSESMKIVITTNYWPIFVVILLIVIIVVAYYIMRSPITLTKEVKIVSTHEGGIKELKVLLRIKNRSGHAVQNLRLIDLVPKICELVERVDAGTLAPSEVIHHDVRGSVLKYVVGTLDVKEERIITYRMKSKYTIVGGIQLPLAAAKFGSGSKVRGLNSNVAEISI